MLRERNHPATSRYSWPRVVPVIALGLGLAAAEWFGLLPAALNLYRAHESLADRFDPRTLSLLSFIANVIVLTVLLRVGVGAAGRRARERTK